MHFYAKNMASSRVVTLCSEGNEDNRGQKRKRQNFKWPEDVHSKLIEFLRTVATKYTVNSDAQILMRTKPHNTNGCE